MDWLPIHLLLTVFFVLCSAFFSGAETALFSLSRARLLDYAAQNAFHRQCIVKLMREYHRTLTGIVLGNMFMNASLAISINGIVSRFNDNPKIALAISLFISLIVLLIGGEVTPKAVAILNNERVADIVAMPMWYYYRFMSPLIMIIEKFHSVFWKIVGRRTQPPLDHDEYYAFVDMARDINAFSDSEIKILEEILDLESLKISKLVKSRMSIECVYNDMTAEELASVIRESKQKFFPVIKDSIDDAELILSARNFFRLSKEARANWQQTNCVFEAVYIPENSPIAKVLHLFERKKVPAALAVDEYGGVTGIISKKEIYSSIFGRIQEEFEHDDWQIKKTGEKKWLIKGNISTEDAENLIPEIVLPESEAASISGLVIEQLGDFPQPAQKVQFGNCSVNILKTENNRISEFEIEIEEINEEEI